MNRAAAVAGMLWRLTLAAMLACAAWCWLAVARTVEALPRQLDATLAREAEATRRVARAAVAESGDAVLAEVRALRALLASELRATREAAMHESVAAREQLGQRLASIEQRIDSRLASVEQVLLEDAERLTTSLEMAMGSYTATGDRAARMVELLTPQALGLVSAAKVSAGELAQTARTWRRETPQIAANVRQATGNVAAATKLSKWQKLLLLGIAGLAAAGAMR